MNDNVCDVELTSPWGTISIIRPQTTHTEENPNICSNMEQFLCRDNSRGQRWVRHVRAQTTSNMLALQVLLCRRKQTNKHTVIMTLFMHLHKKGKIYQNVEPQKKKSKVFLGSLKFMCQSKINKLTNQPTFGFHLMPNHDVQLGYRKLYKELVFLEFKANRKHQNKYYRLATSYYHSKYCRLRIYLFINYNIYKI